jgi:cytochrome c-type biogenesis protein CcmH/NrfG
VIRWTTKILALALLLLPAVAAAADSPSDLLAAGRVDDAISSLSVKLDSAPNDAASYNLLCRAYFAVSNWDRAIWACEKAISLEPTNSEYHLWLGRTYGEKADSSNFFTAAGLAKKVRNEFERAVHLDPNNVAARVDLAEFYLEAPGIVGGGQDKARGQAEAVAHLNPSKAHWIQGRLAEKNKDTASAEREYRAAIEASHGSGNAWLNLGLFYRKAGRFDEMQEALKKAVAAPPDQPEVLVDAASTLLRANRDLPLATQLVRRYLASNTVEQAPPFKAHYLLGNILEKQGDREGAVKEYQTALAMAKDFGRAREALNRISR